MAKNNYDIDNAEGTVEIPDNEITARYGIKNRKNKTTKTTTTKTSKAKKNEKDTTQEESTLGNPVTELPKELPVKKADVSGITGEKRPSTASTTSSTSATPSATTYSNSNSTKQNASANTNGNSKGFYGNYDPNDGLPNDVEELRKEIAKIEDKGMDNVWPSTARHYQELTNKLANITGDAADHAKAVAAEQAALGKNPVLFKNPYDAVTETADSRSEAQKATESMEGKPKPIRGIYQDYHAGQYGNINEAKVERQEGYLIYDADGKQLTEKPVSKQQAEEWIDLMKTSGADTEGYEMKPATGHYYVYDNNGKLYGMYDSKLQANNAKKDLDKDTEKERKRALDEYFTRGFNAFTTSVINSANDTLGEANIKSIHEQDLEDRAKYNNELYYENEKLKSDNVRNLAKLSDEELAKIVSNSNSNIALLTYLIGQKRVNNIMDILGKQEIEQAASEVMANWTPEQKQAYYTWTALVNDRDVNDKLASLISGKTSLDYFANLWKKQTNISLAKDSNELIALEQAIEAAGLQNRMTEAQVDVIRELVAEQLQAAKLGNAQKIQQMATSSVDSISKIIEALIPG